MYIRALGTNVTSSRVRVMADGCEVEATDSIRRSAATKCATKSFVEISSPQAGIETPAILSALRPGLNCDATERISRDGLRFSFKAGTLLCQERIFYGELSNSG